MSAINAKQSNDSLEVLHVLIYFAPEAAKHLGALGLETRRDQYVASRSAPLGAVGPGPVTAAFYNFKRSTIAAALPNAWSIASPETIIETRFRAADDALRRLLGTDTVDSDVVADTARLARKATEGCAPEGKPMFAGVADLEWPEAPHLQLWHAVTQLREFRGDAHIVALQRAGLSGVQAIVLQDSTRNGLFRDFIQKSRGWTDDEWAQAQDSLRERGLLDAEGETTEAGRQLRQDMEDETDALSLAPWQHLDSTELERLVSQGNDLSRTAVRNGALPEGVFHRN